MSRRGALLSALLIVASVPTVGAQDEGWTVAERFEIPLSGGVDLAGYAREGEDPVRLVLVGSYSFLLDGSQIDAVSSTASDGTRDVASAPFVMLPQGSALVESDPETHRYVVEVRRSSDMLASLNVTGLAMRHLVTPTEVRNSLRGTIQVEHLVPPPPPPAPLSTTEAAAETVTEAADGVPVWVWVVIPLAAVGFLVLGFVWARRRGELVTVLIRRARRAHGSIATEVLSLGPAFDPVAASAQRLLEAAVQHGAHYRSVTAAIGRTEWATSQGARDGRKNLQRRRSDVLEKLEGLVGRLEATATELAGRAADADQARGVDALLADLGTDLDAAVEAEEELATV